MFVQAWRNKTPDLVENVGDSDVKREHQRQLEGGQEGGDHPCCDHALPLRQQLHQRAGNIVVDVVGKAKQSQKQD